VASSNVSACNVNDGSIQISGLTANTVYAVTYFNGTATIGPNSLTSNTTGVIKISGLTAGNYSNFRVDMNGCSATNNNTHTILDPSNVTITNLLIPPVACGGTGTIKIALNGATQGTSYNIHYNDGSPDMTGSVNLDTITLSSVPVGTAVTHLVITDNATNCQATSTLTGTVTNPGSVTVTNVLFINSTTCEGTGTIKIVLSGASDGDPYSIDYDNNGITDNRGVVSNDTITLTGITVNTIINGLILTNATTGCKIPSTLMGTITGPTPPTITNVFCISPLQCGGTGTIRIAVSNGVNGENYSIDFNDGSPNKTGVLVNDTIVLSGLASGITITNPSITSTTSGCSAIGNFIGDISDPAPFSIASVVPTDPARCGGLGSILVNITGGTDGRLFAIDFTGDGVVERTVPNNAGVIAINNLAAGTVIGNLTIMDAYTKCHASSAQNITIQDPPPPIVTLPNYNALCMNAPTQALDGGVPEGGNYTIDGNPAVDIDPATLGVGNHTVIYSYTGTNNCHNSDTTSLLVNALPDATILGEQALCPQAQNIIYSAENNSAYQYFWTVVGGTYTLGNQPDQITVNWGENSTGSIQLAITNTVNLCIGIAALTVNFSDTESPVMSRCLSDYHVKASIGENIIYYIFTPADSLCIPKAADRCSPSLSVSFSANNGAVHNVSEFPGFRLNKAGQDNILWTFTDNSKNSSECLVNIIFDLEKIAPTAFSPNGDSHNDTWEIDFLTDYPDCVVKVYNRWGMLVYESEKGYPTPWDGKNNGRVVPVDTYYYTITLGNNEKPIKGYVTVLH
jgi:gliding motility-associated-like protein